MQCENKADAMNFYFQFKLYNFLCLVCAIFVILGEDEDFFCDADEEELSEQGQVYQS